MDQYMSGSDKARKPYKPIDTCSPAGTWIEEKRYNKSRPKENNYNNPNGGGGGGGGIGKVFCGNWQEESALEQDLLQRERELRLRDDAEHRATPLGASLDVIRQVGPCRYAGGFKSSPYLTADAACPEARCLESTHRADYTDKSGQTNNKNKNNNNKNSGGGRPALGVRRQLLLEQALAAAAAAQQQSQCERSARQAAHAQRPGGAGATATGSAALADPATVYTASVYKATISNARAGESTSWDRASIDELRQSHLSEEAITLYTGNPESGKTMTVHGKTPVDPVSASRFGKHTNFSEPKYHL